MAFTGRISISSSFTYQDSSTSTQSTSGTSLVEQSEDYTVGTGSSQAEFAYSKAESSAVAVTYDLNDGSLVDQVGRTMALTKIKALVIRNTTSSTSILTVGDGASNPLSPFGVVGDVVKIGPGGCLALTWPVDGFTVDATHKTLKITPSAAATWEIQIVGSD